MRAALAAFLIGLAVPAWAAEVRVEGDVVAATLYPQGASVERRAVFEVEAGRHTVLIAGMPGQYRRESLRIEGAGAFRILSIAEQTAAVQALEARRQSLRNAIERALEEAQDRREALGNTDAAAVKQLAYIDALINAQAAASAQSEDLSLLSAETVRALWESIGKGAKEALDDRSDVKTALRAVDDEIELLRARLNDLGPQRRLGPLLAVEVEAEAPVSGILTVRYQMDDANWAPVYDARLAMGDDPSVTLVRRAQVRQGTGEDWSGIALTLSTARPGGRAEAPDPRLLFARIEEDVPEVAYSRKAGRVADVMAESMMMAPPPPPPAPVYAEPAQQTMAVAQLDGETVEYAIPDEVDIRGSGAIKQVLIDEQSDAVTLEARATPSRDKTAYLYAAFDNAGDGPILPGTASLYRDSVFVGTIRLERVAPGDETDIAFGSYDPIKVTHAERERMEGEAGIIRSRQTERRRYLLSAQNLGGRAMPVVILDSMPYAEDEDVEIALRAAPMPDEQDVEDRKGALAWRFTLDPGQRREIEHGFDISYPDGVRLFLPR